MKSERDYRSERAEKRCEELEEMLQTLHQFVADRSLSVDYGKFCEEKFQRKVEAERKKKGQ